MSKEVYSYELLSIDNLSELDELFNASFSILPKLDYFKWKYFDNPIGKAIVAGAYINNKLVASGAMIPEQLAVFNEEIITFKCTDLMTHPEHQRKGLSKKINELLLKTTNEYQAKLVYTLCSKISTKSFLKNNWIFLNEVVYFFKPLVLLKISRSFKQNAFLNIQHFTVFTDQLNDYVFETNKATIGIKKTAAFIQWRTSNPNFNYKIICHFNEHNNINGYLIYSISDANILNVIDYESNGKEQSAIVDNLFSYAEHVVVNEKYKGIVAMTVNKSFLFPFFVNKGFIRNPFNKGPLKTILDFNVFVSNTANPDISKTENWDIKGLAYDDV